MSFTRRKNFSQTRFVIYSVAILIHDSITYKCNVNRSLRKNTVYMLMTASSGKIVYRCNMLYRGAWNTGARTASAAVLWRIGGWIRPENWQSCGVLDCRDTERDLSSPVKENNAWKHECYKLTCHILALLTRYTYRIAQFSALNSDRY